jgi:hypothetical protein
MTSLKQLLVDSYYTEDEVHGSKLVAGGLYFVFLHRPVPCFSLPSLWGSTQISYQQQARFAHVVNSNATHCDSTLQNIRSVTTISCFLKEEKMPRPTSSGYF